VKEDASLDAAAVMPQLERVAADRERPRSVSTEPRLHLARSEEEAMNATCTHLDRVRGVVPRTPDGCEECLAMGSTWVHLRLCLSCGHVGCCDDSPNQHATAHFHLSGHPIIASFEPGERWGWCYVDRIFLQPDAAPRRGERIA
jgi:uncharacterized UBP type Zn finger protein